MLNYNLKDKLICISRCIQITIIKERLLCDLRIELMQKPLLHLLLQLKRLIIHIHFFKTEHIRKTLIILLRALKFLIIFIIVKQHWTPIFLLFTRNYIKQNAFHRMLLDKLKKDVYLKIKSIISYFTYVWYKEIDNKCSLNISCNILYKPFTIITLS